MRRRSGDGLDVRSLAKLEQAVEQAAVAQVDLRMFSQALADIRVKGWKLPNEECALEQVNVALNSLVVDAEGVRSLRMVPVRGPLDLVNDDDALQPIQNAVIAVLKPGTVNKCVKVEIIGGLFRERFSQKSLAALTRAKQRNHRPMGEGGPDVRNPRRPPQDIFR